MLHCVTVFFGILEVLHCVTVFLGILEVLHCVLVESPEALNLIKEGHIKSIISLLDKHGRNYKVDRFDCMECPCIMPCTYQLHRKLMMHNFSD